MITEKSNRNPDGTVVSDKPKESEVAIRTSEQRSEAPRERTANFGGPRLKLNVIGRIEGYHLYWANDEEGAIEQLLYEGFEFALPEEVKMTSHIVSDADITNRVSRYVGKKDDGTPLRAFLLKCKEELWQEREAYRYQEADEKDQAIKQSVKASAGRYVPKGVSNDLDNQFSKEY